MSERVLVIKRSNLLEGLSDNDFFPTEGFTDSLMHIHHNDHWKGIFNSYNGAYTQQLLQHGFFVKREIAEYSEEYLQVIPYVTIRSKDEFLTYRRTSKGGEERLHEKFSVGVGGHVNTDDLIKALSSPPPNKVYAELAMIEGVDRELKEELEWDAQRHWLMVNGPIIYDGTNSVGRVHLGVVFEGHLPDKEGVSLKKQEGLADIQWNTIEELLELEDKLEEWSSMYVHYKNQIEVGLCRSN